MKRIIAKKVERLIHLNGEWRVQKLLDEEISKANPKPWWSGMIRKEIADTGANIILKRFGNPPNRFTKDDIDAIGKLLMRFGYPMSCEADVIISCLNAAGKRENLMQAVEEIDAVRNRKMAIETAKRLEMDLTEIPF